MPLLDEQTRRTDRRPSTVWAWAAVVAALSLLWVLGAVVVSALSRADHAARDPVAIMQEVNRNNLQQAEQMARYANWAAATAQLSAVDPDNLSLSNKHTFFRTAGQAYVSSGSPLASARYYERFLSMSVHLNEARCRECHPAAGPGVPPQKLEDELKSPLGGQYAAALKQARRLSATRASLTAELKAKPEDPRLNLLLYHLDTAAGDRKAAEKRADRVRAFGAR